MKKIIIISSVIAAVLLTALILALTLGGGNTGTAGTQATTGSTAETTGTGSTTVTQATAGTTAPPVIPEPTDESYLNFTFHSSMVDIICQKLAAFFPRLTKPDFYRISLLIHSPDRNGD
ncbi:MAG: hypothetical protein IJX27_05050, partial [Clostridia bacterium]|nr:hypothetical protein [Clostridia bacterium]